MRAAVCVVKVAGRVPAGEVEWVNGAASEAVWVADHPLPEGGGEVTLEVSWGVSRSNCSSQGGRGRTEG